MRLFGVIANFTHRPVLMTAYAAGLWASELTRLRVCDVDSQRMCLRVEQGKGSKDRWVPLSPLALEELLAYWHRIRPDCWLFPGHWKHPMSRDGAVQMCRRAKHKSGIDKSGGIHTLRHCYAEPLAKFRAPIRVPDVIQIKS